MSLPTRFPCIFRQFPLPFLEPTSLVRSKVILTRRVLVHVVILDAFQGSAMLVATIGFEFRGPRPFAARSAGRGAGCSSSGCGGVTLIHCAGYWLAMVVRLGIIRRGIGAIYDGRDGLALGRGEIFFKRGGGRRWLWCVGMAGINGGTGKWCLCGRR